MTNEYDVAGMLEAVREFQEDRTMTPAEAAALSGPPNYPTIPVKPCPVRTQMSTDTKAAGLPPRMLMKRTVSYKVHVRTNNNANETLIFNVEPTADLIAEALWLMKVGVPPLPDKANDAEQKRYEQVRVRYENLIALVKIAEIKIPEVKESSFSEVVVAGVTVGHVNIQAREAWTIE